MNVFKQAMATINFDEQVKIGGEGFNMIRLLLERAWEIYETK